MRRSAELNPTSRLPFFFPNATKLPALTRACLGAASLQEFLVCAGDAKKQTKKEDSSLIGCAKVCNNVSVDVGWSGDVFPSSCALRLLVYLQVLSALSNAALNEAFASAVLGKKVSRGKHAAVEAVVAHQSVSLLQAGAIQEKVCAIVASIGPLQQLQSADPLLHVFTAIAEHAVIALSRLLKAAAATSPPMILLSAPVLSSLVHVVSGGAQGLKLSMIGLGGAGGFVRSASLLDAGFFASIFCVIGKFWN